MSITPIFDATLADAPVNIWQASNIFPRPDYASLWARLGLPQEGWASATRTAKLLGQPDYTDWSQINDPRWTAKVTGAVA